MQFSFSLCPKKAIFLFFGELNKKGAVAPKLQSMKFIFLQPLKFYFLSSFIDATAHSVVINIEAILAAFKRALRVTLVGSTIP